MATQPLTAIETDSIPEITPAAEWQHVQHELVKRYGEAVWRSWLKPLEFVEINGSVATLSAPSRFMKEWVLSNYGTDMLNIWRSQNTSVFKVELMIRETPEELQIPANANEETSAWAAGAITSSHLDDPMDEALNAVLDPRFTFDNFVVGKPNELAFAAARRLAESDAVVQGCNPLFLYGGVGLGKTHLMHSIAQHIRSTNPARRVLYLSAEKFMYQFIRALRLKEAMEFKEYFRGVDVLMIDDVQFICGKESTQEEFFHTFNALVDQNKQLVISCDRSPSDLDGIQERIRSRLGWGLVADIHATTYELRLGILQSKVARMQGVVMPPKVLEFLAHKITSNVRELEGALNRVVAHSSLVGQPIALETTQEVLKDLLRANDKRVTVEDIQKIVAGHFDIKISDMHSARRSRMVARPRQIAMYLSKQFTTKSLPEIGRRFGGKDHTTVMHAVKRIDALMAEDTEFASEVELVKKLVQK